MAFNQGGRVSLVLGYLYRQSSSKTVSLTDPGCGEFPVVTDVTDTSGKKLNPNEIERSSPRTLPFIPNMDREHQSLSKYPIELSPSNSHVYKRSGFDLLILYALSPQQMGRNGRQDKQARLLVGVGPLPSKNHHKLHHDVYVCCVDK